MREQYILQPSESSPRTGNSSPQRQRMAEWSGNVYHTWRPIVFIQSGMQDMSIIICAFKVSVDWY